MADRNLMANESNFTYDIGVKRYFERQNWRRSKVRLRLQLSHVLYV